MQLEEPAVDGTEGAGDVVACAEVAIEEVAFDVVAIDVVAFDVVAIDVVARDDVTAAVVAFDEVTAAARVVEEAGVAREVVCRAVVRGRLDPVVAGLIDAVVNEGCNVVVLDSGWRNWKLRPGLSTRKVLTQPVVDPDEHRPTT